MVARTRHNIMYSASFVMNRNTNTPVPQAISGFDSRYEKDFVLSKRPDRLPNKPCHYSVGISPGVHSRVMKLTNNIFCGSVLRMDGAILLSMFHFIINIKCVSSQIFCHVGASHRPPVTAVTSDFCNAIVCD